MNEYSTSRPGSVRVVVLAFLAAIVIGTSAATATGTLDVGSVIPGGEPSGPPDNRLPVDQTVLATGTAPVAGPWQLVAFESEGISAGGEVLEPRGLPCMRLVLTDPPPGNPLAGSGFCGETDGRNFDIANVPAKGEGGRVEVLLFGHTPEQAEAVLLTAGRGERIRVATREGPEGFPGDVWVMSARPDLEGARVDWITQDGEPADAQRDADPQLDRGRRLSADG